MNKVKKLEKFKKEAEIFASKNITGSNPEFVAWNNSLIRFMEKEYGINSTTTNNFRNRKYSLSIYPVGTSEERFISVFKRDMNVTLAELSVLLEEEQENIDDIEGFTQLPEINKNSKKVFIVHGRDESKKYELYGFLHDQGLQPIILHDQVNNGRTIIEKIENNSDVACAIILLTPDDVGKLNDDKEQLKTRARQNVIFEAGYFMGKLGRDRTILISGVEENLSDIDGIVYLDINNYRYNLLKELKELGLIEK